MSDENLLTRREFTVESALAMLAGVTITISGCGGDDNATPAPTPTPPPAADKTGTVSTDAGHTHTGAVHHGGSIDGWKCDYFDPYGRHHTHSHGGAQSDRAHARSAQGRECRRRRPPTTRTRTPSHSTETDSARESVNSELPRPNFQALDENRFGGWELEIGS